MTVYVDDAFIPAGVANGGRTVRSRWCHLTADTPGELHVFAARVGLRRAWFQDKPGGRWHYDVTEPRRARAVELGAVEISWRDMATVVMRTAGREGVQATPIPAGDPRP